MAAVVCSAGVGSVGSFGYSSMAEALATVVGLLDSDSRIQIRPVGVLAVHYYFGLEQRLEQFADSDFLFS